jgi:aminopeptidase N
MEALYAEHHLGEDAYRFAIWDDQNDARTEDDTLYRRPIVSRHYAYPEQMFDNTTYLKGAAVLAMLRYVLGDQGFFASLHSYLVANREKNVDVANLMEAIRETTGQNLDWFFHEWLFMGGYPEYKVRAIYDPQQRVEVVTVEQTQKLNAVTPLFDMPVELAFHGPNGTVKQVRVRVHRAAETFYVPLEFRPLWTSFDPNDELYKTLDFEKPVPELAEQAVHDPVMMSRLWATLELGRRGKQSYDAALTALSQVLQHDQEDRVRAAAAESLGELGGDEAKTVLLATLNDRDRRVRAGAAAGLAHFHGDSSVGQALVRLLQDDSYAVQMAAAVSLGRSQSPQAFEALRAALPQAKDDHVIQGILVGLAASQHDGAAKLLLAEARPGVPEFPRVIAMRLLPQVQSQIAENDPDLDAVVQAGLKDSFSFAQTSAMGLVAAFKLEKYKPELEQLASSLPTADQRKSATDALNSLEGHPTAAQTIGEPPTVSELEQQVKQLQNRLQTLEKTQK